MKFLINANVLYFQAFSFLCIQLFLECLGTLFGFNKIGNHIGD